MKTWFTALSLSFFALTTSHADIKTVEQNLKQNFPDIPVKSVKTSPVKDIYEVYMGGRIVYTTDEAKYFFVGNLIDLKQQKNLTEESMQTLSKVEVAKLPLDQAIKHVKGKGERVIYLFSDPDCPYCQKLEHEIQKIDNLTVYLFLYPIPSLHPNAVNISNQIWCSKKPYQAWLDYTLEKKQPTNSKTCSTPISKIAALGKQFDISGTPTLFLKDGTRISGIRSAEELEKVLK